jgi:hypothetical protein
MNIREEAIKKINQLPDKLVPEVSLLLDFLLTQENWAQWQMWEKFKESLQITESDFSDYLENLEDYERRLARGEIRW